MELTNENYHSIEARKEYMGYSQFKSFEKCEKEALALINGEIEEKSSDAFLFGGYIDAYFSNELEEFTKAHPEMFNNKTGEFKAPFKNIDSVINTIDNDELLKKYLCEGQHQVIMTGEIEGVKVKIKIDTYHPNKVIIDGKCMKSMEDVWIERVDENGIKRNVKVDFITAYDYMLEGALYQEIERQFSHHTMEERLPFVLAVVTKEENCDKALIRIDQEYLDEALERFKSKVKRYDDIKKGLVQPIGCGECGVCRKQKKLTGIFSYKKLFKSDSEIEY